MDGGTSLQFVAGPGEVEGQADPMESYPKGRGVGVEPIALLPLLKNACHSIIYQMKRISLLPLNIYC